MEVVFCVCLYIDCWMEIIEFLIKWNIIDFKKLVDDKYSEIVFYKFKKLFYCVCNWFVLRLL